MWPPNRELTSSVEIASWKYAEVPTELGTFKISLKPGAAISQRREHEPPNLDLTSDWTYGKYYKDTPQGQ